LWESGTWAFVFLLCMCCIGLSLILWFNQVKVQELVTLGSHRFLDGLVDAGLVTSSWRLLRGPSELLSGCGACHLQGGGRIYP
jgi:hypothetical protein